MARDGIKSRENPLVHTGPVVEDGAKYASSARARFSDWYSYQSQRLAWTGLLLLGIMSRRFENVTCNTDSGLATEQCEDGSKRRRMRARGQVFRLVRVPVSKATSWNHESQILDVFVFFFLAALDAAFPALGHPTQAEPLAGRA